MNNHWSAQYRFFGLWKQQLEQITIKLTTNQYLLLHAVIALGLYILSVGITQNNQPASLAFGILGLFLPRFYTIMMIGNRITRFKNQLPDTVTIWVNSLRSGQNVVQGMEAIARNAPEPASTEFALVIRDISFGLSQEDAINRLLERVADQDLDFILTSVNIQREVGGNLAEILDVIAGTIRERIKLTRELAIQVKARYRIFFMIAVAVTILQWVVFDGYFSSALTVGLAGQVALWITFTAMTLTFYTSVSANHRLRTMNISADNQWLLLRDDAFDLLGGVTFIIIAYALGVPSIVLLWLSLLMTFLVRRYALLSLTIALLNVITMVFSSYNISDLPDLLSGDMAIMSVSGRLGNVFESIIAIMTMLGTLGFLTLIIITLTGIIRAMRSSDSDPLVERLATYDDDDEASPYTENPNIKDPTRWDRLRKSSENRILALMSWTLDHFLPQSIVDQMREQAQLQDKPFPVSRKILWGRVWWVLGSMLMSAIIAFTILRIGFISGVLLIMLGFIMGIILPMIYQRNQRQRTKENMTNSLPDALDLMMVCMEAGLGFDSAMAQIYGKWDNDLALNFGRVIREIQLGKPRRDALTDMASRLDVADVSTFVAAIVQSDQLGVPIVRTLRVQSAQMRSNWKQTFEGRVENYNLILDYFSLFIFAPAMNLWLISPVIAQFFG